MDLQQRNHAPVNWARHTLIWLTEKGRFYAADHIMTQSWETLDTKACPSKIWKKELILNPLIPGIICRQPSAADNRLPVLQPESLLAGFSHWRCENGSRLRMTASFETSAVHRSCSPFDLCKPDYHDRICRAYPQLEAIFSIAGRYGIKLGLFGSTALEWVTGYPYRHRNSDLDLCIRLTKDADLYCFGKALIELENRCSTRLDVEVAIADGYGIKLKELLSPSRTVLAKGLYDVKLLEKNTIFS